MLAEYLFYFISVFKVLLLNISKTYSDSVEKQTSECHLSKETSTMHIIQMAQEQHAIYFGYTLVFGQFYRNRKGLKKRRLKKSLFKVFVFAAWHYVCKTGFCALSGRCV